MTETWPRGRSRHGGIDAVPLEGVPTAVGRMWLAGKRYVAPDPGAAMDSVRATRIVCLCEEHELIGHYPDYVRWLKADPAAHWYPIPDLHAPRATDGARMVERLTGLLESGESVIVHCGAGMGRAGTMAAAVLIRAGAPIDDALATVAAARPGAGPEAGAQTEFLRALPAN